MDLTVSPLTGVGNIVFGMLADDVRRRMAAVSRPFTRTKESKSADHFVDLGALCYYDAAGALEAMEFASPARPTINGIELLGVEFGVARQRLATLDANFEEEVCSLTSHKIGVSLWAPLAKDDASAPVESMLVFRPGYYS